MHCQNVRLVFYFTETVHSQNKSHAKFKAFTVNEEILRGLPIVLRFVPAHSHLNVNKDLQYAAVHLTQVCFPVFGVLKGKRIYLYSNHFLAAQL